MSVAADFKQGSNLAGKILASGQVAAATTDTTVYTVPASSAAKIATAVLCNVGAGATTVSVSVVPSGVSLDATRRVVQAYTLTAGDTTSIAEIVGAFLDAGAYISLNAGAATSVNYLITGVVSS